MIIPGLQTRFDISALPVGPRRPAILIRAAEAGQPGWRRDRDLPRILGMDRAPAPRAALEWLRDAEGICNDSRRLRDPTYDPHRHVRLMIALLAELRAAKAQAPQWLGPAGEGGITCRGTSRPAHRA